MYLFFITVFTLYGGMHLYAFLKIKNAFHPGPGTYVFLILLMLTMTFAPFIVRISEKQGFDFFARSLSYTGYTWMGVLFLFFVFSLTFDLFRFSVYAGEFFLQKDLSHLKPSALLTFTLPLLLSLSISVYGYLEAQNIRTEKVTIKTDKIPEDVGRIRIVQISDVHTGLIVREKRLKKILRQVKLAEPDIFVSTGDLVDGQIDNLSALSGLFHAITPRYGKFAITGNHEYYAGLEQALNFTQKAGFTVLRGQGLTIHGLINIAGVDDPAGKPYGLYTEVSEKDILSRLPNEKFTLFLKHRPLVDSDSIGLFDLQLSGHTHKGQIFPFSLATRLYYPIHAGYSNIKRNVSLYVSRGSGTWGPPIRFLSPPEVTVFDLIHDKGPKAEN
jgi:predicted MPP superfamily phosphohydrolase